MFVFKVQTFKQHSGGVLRKSWLKICSKFTGKHSCQSAKQIYWNHTSVRLLHIFKTPFPKNKYGGLLLHVFPKLTLLSSTYFLTFHCLKSVHVRSFLWSVISLTVFKQNTEIYRANLFQIPENKDQKKLHFWTLFRQSLSLF